MALRDNYEANQPRTDRWLLTFPEGRIEASIVDIDLQAGWVLFCAKGWRNQQEVEPADTSYAYGYKAAYPPHMQRWFVEDTETSAKMRVRANMLGGTNTATKETMQQIDDMTENQAQAQPSQEPDYWTTKFGEIPSYKTAAEAEQAGVPSFGSSITELATQLGGQLVAEKPRCIHGTRVWKQGETKATGKLWGGYFCVERSKSDQCEPEWYKQDYTGDWVVRG